MSEIEKLLNEVRQAIKKQTYSYRSCWECNSAHDHLKKHDVLICLACEYIFVRGKKIIHIDELQEGDKNAQGG